MHGWQRINYKDDNDWGNYALGMAKILSDHGYRIGGLDAAIYGNIPNGAGLSSSASLELLIGKCSIRFTMTEKFPVWNWCVSDSFAKTNLSGYAPG